MAECEQSLRRLKTDYIDLYQIHWEDKTTPIEETMEAVDRLMQQGKVRAAGVSNFSAKLSDQAAACIPLTSNQLPYSMLRRDIEDETVPWCRKNEISILAYSPLQRGLLTGKIGPEYEFNKGDSRPGTPYFSKENITRVNAFLDKIKPIADDRSATLGQIVIAWTIAQPGITVALLGARNRKQVEENIKAMDIILSENELMEINLHLNQLQLTL